MPKGAVRLYNSMTQRLEPLETREPGHVGLYVCGLTTYDHAHAGHARTFVAFDVLVRHLRARGWRVTYVTDVDDKILKRARDNGEAPLDLSKRMSLVNAEELRGCGCTAPDHEPRVSETIPEIVQLIEELVAKGAAYPAKTDVGTDVYFSVRAFPGYGKLSHRNVDDLLSGARVEVGETKQDPLDFALWKASAPESLGWDSPWGRGRPGWHIECSAMAKKLLGPHFDVHGGGMDLVFPHHENEIAQSEAAWGDPFSKTWLHAGFLNVDSEKMSKSLGNFVTIAQVLDRNDGEALRYFLCGAHYRSQVSFDLEKLADGRVVFPGVASSTCT
jgi:cysteinyl-tRNA synthetase